MQSQSHAPPRVVPSARLRQSQSQGQGPPVPTASIIAKMAKHCDAHMAERLDELLADRKALKAMVKECWHTALSAVSSTDQRPVLDLAGLRALCEEVERTTSLPAGAFGDRA